MAKHKLPETAILGECESCGKTLEVGEKGAVSLLAHFTIGVRCECGKDNQFMVDITPM